MALIWAEGFTGEKALAPLYKRYIEASERLKTLESALSGDTPPSPADLGSAIIEKQAAEKDYKSIVDKAEFALADTARQGEKRTHALVVGVGHYADTEIKALTTSVLGAGAFAGWMLTRFQHPDRPLGSVELLLSPGDLGDWRPSLEAAKMLGLTDGSATVTLPAEKAIFANIKEAFERWLKRAGAHIDNAAFFYFSGHGIWKQDPYLLPEDAQIANSTRGFDNLIHIQGTEENMRTRQPSVQCFFVDACQEVISESLENASTKPLGEPLCGFANGATIPDRNAYRYEGAQPARKAFGPEDGAPFFTQELLACLERRGAAAVKVGQNWCVTMSSLQEALNAAYEWRKEVDEKAQGIKFQTVTDASSRRVILCQIQGSPEVIVQIECNSVKAMPLAKLFIESGGIRSPRRKPLPSPWFTKVAHGGCLAGAEFEASAAFESAPESFETIPPVHPVQLTVKQRP